MTATGFTRRFVTSLVGCSWFAASMLFASSSLAQWRPDSAIEIVVPSGPGSGLDTTGRTVLKVLQEQKLLPMPATVVNKPGAGGSIAYLYLNSRPGNAHAVSITSPGVVTNRLVGASKIGHTDLVPIAHLFDENIVFMVRSDSPIANGKDLLARLRADPAAVSFGIATALGGANHIATVSVTKAAGIDARRMRNAVYKSGGEVTAALLGGHVDVVPIAAPVAVPHLQAGKIRLLAVSSSQRLPGPLASVPTWREQGTDSVYSTWRGVVAAKGITREQIAFWDDVFAALARTDTWRAELERKLWVGNYLNSEDSRRFLEAQSEEHRVLLGELGMLK